MPFFTDISVSADGLVIAVDKEGGVRLRKGVSTAKLAGVEWAELTPAKPMAAVVSAEHIPRHTKVDDKVTAAETVARLTTESLTLKADMAKAADKEEVKSSCERAGRDGAEPSDVSKCAELRKKLGLTR